MAVSVGLSTDQEKPPQSQQIMEENMQTFRFRRFGLIAALFGWLVLAGILTACNSDDDAAVGDTSETGDLVVSLTDAQGDFATYTVDVQSLTLTRANGAVVNVVPETTRIDFAQYTDMTEFFTVASVPLGAYTAARMTLNYVDADIQVETADGAIMPVADILDENEEPLTQVEVTVQLEGRNRLVIAPGLATHLQLDFDLKATHAVNFEDSVPPSASVTVSPMLIADVNRVSAKIHRLRGILESVNTGDSTFAVYLRPFYYTLTGDHQRFGSMTVVTDSETVFDVNGTSYQGAEGLTAMAGLDDAAAVIAVGALKFNPLRFEAEQVYAGASVPWGNQDAVTGSVLARDGDTLTVKGATLERGNGSVMFHDTVTVTIAETTRVTRQLCLQDFTTDDVSVGQHVTVFGSLVDDDPLNLVVDATDGTVQLKTTMARGNVTAVDDSDPVSQLHLDLQSINLNWIDEFDFSGTGAGADNTDADPHDYEVSTGTMDLSALAVGDPVKVWGYVQPFGQAPQDFNAQSLIQVADVVSILKVHWFPAANDAFTMVSADGLTLNMTGLGLFHYVSRAGVLTDLTIFDDAPQVVPRSADGNEVFILHIGSTTQVSLNFADYADELGSLIEDGWLVKKINALGLFDDDTVVLSADLVDITLQRPMTSNP